MFLWPYFKTRELELKRILRLLQNNNHTCDNVRASFHLFFLSLLRVKCISTYKKQACKHSKHKEWICTYDISDSQRAKSLTWLNLETYLKIFRQSGRTITSEEAERLTTKY